MADRYDQERLAEHRDQLVRARQADAERARDARERRKEASRTEVAEIAKEGNLEAMRLQHELEPEKRHWDLTSLIEEERIKLETFTNRTLLETREQIRLITAELLRELVLDDRSQARTLMDAELQSKQTTLERSFDLQAERERAEQKRAQTELEHGHELDRAAVDHRHAKDFKTHETDELIRLKRTFGELTRDEKEKFFAQFEEEARKARPDEPS